MSKSPNAVKGAQQGANLAQLENIAVQFAGAHTVSTVEPLGNGNINQTFLVTLEDQVDSNQADSNPSRGTAAKRFVLQQINQKVFQQPELVIQNMVVLGNHLNSLTEELPRRWETPYVLSTRQGQNFWRDDAGEYWRAISFIEESQVLEKLESQEHAKEVGTGLAMFHRVISSLPAEKLADTLEGFHITPQYLATYQQVLAQKSQANQHLTDELSPERAQQVQYCLDFIESRRDWAHVLEQAKADGHLQLRPIHGDPKVNNIMLGKDGKAISLIDLDTLKPGLIHYDIGDCLRSGCNPLGEETQDWQAVAFDTTMAKAMLEGYLSVAKDFLTPQDYNYLYDGIRLIAFELGLRFFTDYLAGDVYFKVKYPGHNLMRSLVQFKLTESIEAQADSLKAMIEELRP